MNWLHWTRHYLRNSGLKWGTVYLCLKFSLKLDFQVWIGFYGLDGTFSPKIWVNTPPLPPLSYFGTKLKLLNSYVIKQYCAHSYLADAAASCALARAAAELKLGGWFPCALLDLEALWLFLCCRTGFSNCVFLVLWLLKKQCWWSRPDAPFTVIIIFTMQQGWCRFKSSKDYSKTDSIVIQNKLVKNDIRCQQWGRILN